MIYSTDHTINVWFSRQEFLLYQLFLKKTREGWCVKERERRWQETCHSNDGFNRREDRQRVKERRVRNEMRGWNFFQVWRPKKERTVTAGEEKRWRTNIKDVASKFCSSLPLHIFLSSSLFLSVSRGTKNETEEEKLNKKVENETCGILCQDFLLSLFLFCLSLEATFHFSLFDLCLYCICYSLLLFVWSRILPFYCSWFTVSPGFWWCLLSFPIFLRLSLSFWSWIKEWKTCPRREMAGKTNGLDSLSLILYSLTLLWFSWSFFLGCIWRGMQTFCASCIDLFPSGSFSFFHTFLVSENWKEVGSCVLRILLLIFFSLALRSAKTMRDKKSGPKRVRMSSQSERH